MDSPDLKARTQEYALRIVRMYGLLPKSVEAQVLGKQVLRSGTSAGAHYREAFRARSTAEFVSKIEGGLQELEETEYWLELLIRSGILDQRETLDLLAETKELNAISTASAKTAKKRI
jgi:four helix bundle protein